MEKMQNISYLRFFLHLSAGIAITALLFFISRHNYILFHTLAELFAILIACSMFIVVWNTRDIIRNSALVFLGIAYLHIGGLDLLHTLAYKGMGILGTDAGANSSTQLWIATRYIESVTLCVAPFTLARRLHYPSIFFFYFCLASAMLYAIGGSDLFPDCYLEGTGLTTFKRVSEYIIVFLLCCAMYFWYLQKEQLEESVFQYLIVSLVFSILAEISFTYYASVYGFSNFIGHIFKIISFYMLYRALIRAGLQTPYHLLFREIAESENRYRQMFETNKAVKLIINPSDGRIAEANDAACAYYGYSKEELTSLRITDINMLSPTAIASEMERAEHEQKMFFSFPHRLRSGEIRDVEVYSGPIPYKEKTYLYSIVHDVTERNQAEDALRRYGENLQQIFDSSPNILLLVDKDLRIEMTNRRGADFTGHTKEELPGLAVGSALNCRSSSDSGFCEESSNCEECLVRNTLYETFATGRSSWAVEVTLCLLLDGIAQSVDVLMTTALLRLDESPKVLLSLFDVTQSKKNEEEIRFQAMLLNHIQDHVTATDVHGNITYVNKAVAESLQRSKKELLGSPVHILGENPVQGATQKEILEQTLAQGFWHGEIINHTKDGSEIIFDCRTKLLRDSNNSPSTIIGISTDITKQKQLEKHIQHTQKLESIGTLAGGIAHDFNNLLYPVIGMAEMLLEDLPPQSPEYTKAQVIFDSAQQGSSLVQQILAFGRRSPLAMRPLRLQQTIRSALRFCRSTIPASIQIATDIQRKCGMVNADEGQIQHVLINLLTNAYNAVDAKTGKISLALTECKVETDLKLSSGTYACLSVSDNGCGIPRHSLNTIFDPYSTTQERGNGTGLGLAAVYGIVREHHGEIKVFSAVDQGTTFEIFLPISAQNDADTAPKNAVLPAATAKILLVDDDEMVLTLEKQMLDRLGYHVTALLDSVHALETFQHAPGDYDLAIVDLDMPHLNGKELAGEFKKIRSDIKIMLCTGHSDRIDEQSARSAGIDGFLFKPVSKSYMAEELEKILARS